VTTLSVATGLKFVPEIVTDVPAGPEPGLVPVIVGLGTVKLLPLVPVRPATVTLILPVVAADGTTATSCVAEAEVGVDVVPLKVTVSFAGFESKFVPVIVTGVPKTPLDGLRPETVGTGVTVKFVLLVAVRPLTITLIGPVAALLGTLTTSRVVVGLVGAAAATPLNLTVS
jgi:hypothetical protein